MKELIKKLRVKLHENYENGVITFTSIMLLLIAIIIILIVLIFMHRYGVIK
jgi:hypothetical protein